MPVVFWILLWVVIMGGLTALVVRERRNDSRKQADFDQQRAQHTNRVEAQAQHIYPNRGPGGISNR